MALLQNMTCNLRHPMGIRHPVLTTIVGCYVVPIIPHMYERHTHMNEACCTYEWVTLPTRMRQPARLYVCVCVRVSVRVCACAYVHARVNLFCFWLLSLVARQSQRIDREKQRERNRERRGQSTGTRGGEGKGTACTRTHTIKGCVRHSCSRSRYCSHSRSLLHSLCLGLALNQARPFSCSLASSFLASKLVCERESFISAA